MLCDFIGSRPLFLCCVGWVLFSAAWDELVGLWAEFCGSSTCVLRIEG